jgi:hypothetical protein
VIGLWDCGSHPVWARGGVWACTFPGPGRWHGMGMIGAEAGQGSTLGAGSGVQSATRTGDRAECGCGWTGRCPARASLGILQIGGLGSSSRPLRVGRDSDLATVTSGPGRRCVTAVCCSCLICAAMGGMQGLEIVISCRTATSSCQVIIFAVLGLRGRARGHKGSYTCSR